MYNNEELNNFYVVFGDGSITRLLHFRVPVISPPKIHGLKAGWTMLVSYFSTKFCAKCDDFTKFQRSSSIMTRLWTLIYIINTINQFAHFQKPKVFGDRFVTNIVFQMHEVLGGSWKNWQEHQNAIKELTKCQKRIPWKRNTRSKSAKRRIEVRT